MFLVPVACLASKNVDAGDVQVTNSRQLVTAKLVSARSAAMPGDLVQLGVELTIAPDWHIYWLHPGDAGKPTRIEREVHHGAETPEVQWPTPTRFVSFDVIHSLGYAGKVVIPATAKLSKSATLSIAFAANVTYLACHNDCVPGTAGARLELPVADSSHPTDFADEIAAAQARVPSPLARADRFRLQLHGPDGAAPGQEIELGIELRSRPWRQGEVHLNALYINAAEGVIVGRGVRVSAQQLEVPLWAPEDLKVTAGNPIATAVAEVAVSRDGETKLRFVALEFPTKFLGEPTDAPSNSIVPMENPNIVMSTPTSCPMRSPFGCCNAPGTVAPSGVWGWCWEFPSREYGHARKKVGQL